MSTEIKIPQEVILSKIYKLSQEEFEYLRSQGDTKYASMAFTEQGVSMLSSILNSVAFFHSKIFISIALLFQ